MEVKTYAVVISNRKYSNSSLITRLYTRSHGLLTFMVKSAFQPKSRMHVSLFQPLQILETQLSYRPNRNFQQLREVHAETLAPETGQNIQRTYVSLFITELLANTLAGEEAPNQSLFDFLRMGIEVLKKDDKPTHFPHAFMLELSKYVGIVPENNYNAHHNAFDIHRGGFSAWLPNQQHLLDPDSSESLSALLRAGFAGYHHLNLPNLHKQRILEALNQYFIYHLPGFRRLKSHKMLGELNRER